MGAVPTMPLPCRRAGAGPPPDQYPPGSELVSVRAAAGAAVAGGSGVRVVRGRSRHGVTLPGRYVRAKGVEQQVKARTVHVVRRRWVSDTGWDLEVISLDGRRLVRVRHHLVLRGYCRSLAEVRTILEREGGDLGDFVELVEMTDRALRIAPPMRIVGAMQSNPLDLDLTQAPPPTAPHEPDDGDKLKQLIASMNAEGWAGPPIVTSADQDRAYTGAHRLAAWADSDRWDQPVPCVSIEDIAAAIGMDWGALMDDHDGDGWEAATEVAFAAPPAIRDAYGLDTGGA